MTTAATGPRFALLTPLLAVLALMVGFAPALVAAPASAATSNDQLVAQLRLMQAETGQYILDNYEPTGLGVEWKALGLARNDTPGAQAWLDTYYSNLVDDVVEKDGVLGAATEYERVILALGALNRDPTDVGGHNLLEGVADMSKLPLLNQVIFALIALDSRDYAIPTVAGVTTPTTRQGLVDRILTAELAAGGWAFFGARTDPDMTGMALQALVPYVGQPEVSAAVGRAVTALSELQRDSGGYASFGESVESATQVITALAALGIDPDTDPRFIKSGGSAAAALTTFYVDGGGFWYSTPSTTRNSMSTEQGFYGIAAYLRFVDGRNSLYDMRDAGEPAPPVPPKPTPPTSNPGKAAATVKVTVKKSRVKRGTNAVFVVKVTAPGARPSGKVRVTFAGRNVSARLNAAGTARVKVPVNRTVKPGKKAVRVVYLGDSRVKKATIQTKKVVRVRR
ncbi:MAG TPA: hypothetical protein VMF51_24515 [Nocardioides sp.]|uniref:hypothetical protein n=1 Tax=Nocardioides sp. TaxID=35761 RepID=UPI002D138296|nr:hypothetical protein [Nocardioides sp.]HTW18310.1 hypothetical protein [Nocardioides sp.]